MDSQPFSLDSAYDAGAFRALGHALVDAMAAYLEETATRADVPVLRWRAPRSEVPSMEGPASGNGPAALAAFWREILDGSHHLVSPRYIGHQVAPPLPLAAMHDALASLLNNGMAIYEMGPVGTALERRVLRWMADRIGFGTGADGVLTSGGSLGNLTALLAMRQVKAGEDTWETGSSTRDAVLVSDQAHYSVARAVRVMGWGGGGAVGVATDDRFRMRPDDLGRALEAARGAGRRVIGVVASACTTATGSFDPLDAVADFCEREDLWFHVDAAHGGPACLSERHRDLVRGMHRADSVIWDAHKMLLMPALCTAVIFRNGEHSAAPFAQDASYLFDQENEDAWFNIGRRTLECTKRMMALPLVASLVACGEGLFVDYVERTFDRARTFAADVESAPDFVLAVPPEANIVCFRHAPGGSLLDDAGHARIRRTLTESGDYYVTEARLCGLLHLRITIMNPLTESSHLRGLLDRIREIEDAPGV